MAVLGGLATQHCQCQLGWGMCAKATDKAAPCKQRLGVEAARDTLKNTSIGTSCSALSKIHTPFRVHLDILKKE